MNGLPISCKVVVKAKKRSDNFSSAAGMDFLSAETHFYNELPSMNCNLHGINLHFPWHML